MNLQHDVRGIARNFQMAGGFISAEPHGHGHINDTYLVVIDGGRSRRRHIFQRINHHVFKQPELLMENIRRVTAHLGAKLEGEIDRDRRTLTLIAARDGRPCHRDEAGNWWRVYPFIERARAYAVAEMPAQAFAAGKAYGCFQRMLADLPAPRLHETIPDFHGTPKRFAALEGAIAADAVNRAASARDEIEFALRQKPMTGVLLAAGLPERVTHNDTKFDNVMLDEATGEGICVVDLDTVMPGLAPHDFGDMIRTTTSPVMEDERDLNRVTMQMAMFEGLARGYLSAAGDWLTRVEKGLLAFSGKVITFEMGIRFLADFLAGDIYYKVQREHHNLDRCRAQFKLVQSIEQQEEQMNKLIATMG